MATTNININIGEWSNTANYDLSLDKRAEKLSSISSMDGDVLECTLKDILATNNTFLEKNPTIVDNGYEKPSKSGIQLTSCVNFHSITGESAYRKACLENLKGELSALYNSSNDDTVSKLDQLRNASKYVKATDTYRTLSCKSTAERREVYEKMHCNETLFCTLFDIALFRREKEDVIICASIYNNFYGNDELLEKYKNASEEEARQLYLDNIEIDQVIEIDALDTIIVYDVKGRRNNKSVALLVDIVMRIFNEIAQNNTERLT